VNRLDTDLEKAKKAAKLRAEKAAKEAPPPREVDDDEAACFVRLVIEMFTSGLRLGMGTMPDGMAVWIRLSIPREAESPYAGLVSFVVSDDTLTVLRKAVASLEAAPQPPYWKPDQFARGNASTA